MIVSKIQETVDWIGSLGDNDPWGIERLEPAPETMEEFVAKNSIDAEALAAMSPEEMQSVFAAEFGEDFGDEDFGGMLAADTLANSFSSA